MNKIDFLYNKYKYQGEDTSKFLSHYGIIGQKWGQRRWQNADGTFNEEGKIRYFGKKSGDKIGGWVDGKPFRYDKNGKLLMTDWQYADGSLTKKGIKLMERTQKHPKWFTTKYAIDEDMYNNWKKEQKEERDKKYTEAHKDEIEKQNRDNKMVNEIKSNIKTTKELSGNEINDQEFKDIIKELDNFDMGDFEKNHREDYNKVADIGIHALNKAEGYIDAEIGDDGDREWFMWEDQTIGNPELAYLYYKGYSKDYVKQYLDKVVDDESKYTDNEYSKGFFVKDEFHRGGDAYIDALYDKGEDNQKIGGWFSDDYYEDNKDYSILNQNYPAYRRMNDLDRERNRLNKKLDNTSDEYDRRNIERDLERINKEMHHVLKKYIEPDQNERFGSQPKNSNSKNNNWDYFNEAVAKLGLNNKKKLSSADWNKINKEILKLKS